MWVDGVNDLQWFWSADFKSVGGTRQAQWFNSTFRPRFVFFRVTLSNLCFADLLCAICAPKIRGSNFVDLCSFGLDVLVVQLSGLDASRDNFSLCPTARFVFASPFVWWLLSFLLAWSNFARRATPTASPR